MPDAAVVARPGRPAAGEPAPLLRPAADGPAWPRLLPLLTLLAALLLWEAAVRLLAVPAWLLPAPSHIASVLWTRREILAPAAGLTATATLLGLLFGVLLGMAVALAMAFSRLLDRALAPLVIAAQALPLIALAPLLVVWLGFGLASKVAMAMLTIFFAVSAAFHEGLRRTDPGLVDLGRLYGASRWQMLALIRWPAALPSLGAGLKLASAYAPIGAITGEWVGASGGLGLLMIQSNARMQTDMVFAALAILVVFALGLRLVVGRLADHWSRFTPDTL
jgi:putative hydroxymethylpyrimidine transport system permease protein